ERVLVAREPLAILYNIRANGNRLASFRTNAAPRTRSTNMRPAARRALATALLTLLALWPAGGQAQGTAEDYARSASLASRLRGTVYDVAESPTWLANNRFWYRKSVQGGNAFVLVDATTQEKRPAFDHERIAAALSAARDTTYAALDLPFNTFRFENGESAIVVEVADSLWRCGLSENACVNRGPAPQGPRFGQGGGGGFGQGNQQSSAPRRSPDGKLEAFVLNYNVAVREVGSDEVRYLSREGSEGEAYEL